jgi:hypothetical protein
MISLVCSVLVPRHLETDPDPLIHLLDYGSGSGSLDSYAGLWIWIRIRLRLRIGNLHFSSVALNMQKMSLKMQKMFLFFKFLGSLLIPYICIGLQR